MKIEAFSRVALQSQTVGGLSATSLDFHIRHKVSRGSLTFEVNAVLVETFSMNSFDQEHTLELVVWEVDHKSRLLVNRVMDDVPCAIHL